MEASGYFSVARRWWWTLVAASAVAAVAGFLAVSQIAPTYQARVELLVGPYNTDTDTLGAAGRLVQTYAELVTTEPLLGSAIAETRADVSVSALQARTRAVANDATRILAIEVQDTDPERARDLANALGDEIAQLASLDTSRPEGQVQVIDAARLPTVPIAPQVPLFVGVAALAALLGVLVLMMLVEYLSPTVRTTEDLERVTDLPFLGRLDTIRKIPASGFELVDRVTASRAAAAYRMVAAKLAFDDAGQPVRSLLVVGTANDGVRGQVAVNLAAVIAHGGRRVVLIDADSTDTQISGIFEPYGQGLADIIRGSTRKKAGNLLQLGRTLRLMPRGTAEAADAVDTAHVSNVLATLRRSTDLVVVSAGPLQLSASALIWARACDATVVVGVRDVSRRDDMTAAIEDLHLVGVQPQGAILAVRRRSLGRGSSVTRQPEHLDEPLLDIPTPLAPVVDAPAPRAPKAPRSRAPRAPRASRGPGRAGDSGP